MLDIHNEILATTRASAIIRAVSVQTLWSGYGEIKRYFLEGGEYPSVIVKHIQLPEGSQHPRGWNTPLSHLRKLKSYEVERKWYQDFAEQTATLCRVPHSYHAVEEGNELLLIIEDLDASGYTIRLDPDDVTLEDAKSCLAWLAHFHAKFMNVAPLGLWPTGTYWHLDTRPDEWARMRNTSLKHAAKAIDSRLKHAKYQTLVHGDAKLANFCFSETGLVAAVDFQYVGKGCGMKDVAYLISSCFEEEACEKYEEELLNHYFQQLETTLDNNIDYQEVKEEWRLLYPYAWADFYRFLDGWSPGHWKMHDYSKRLTRQVIDELKIK
ncbi:phosphotransferase [Fulvivirga sp. 29W222]|uniref:Phosphotransferase n=1 Tax=Fulvivirga marina TaxID=2494733 RepID=A0A937G227_9BACT|nr:phosphotransferase [Fulvivirga marina]MBL6448613.1 phosphotransferase [Fulvivirga marina]